MAFYGRNKIMSHAPEGKKRKCNNNNNINKNNNNNNITFRSKHADDMV
jgi:hypothetical protein